MSTLGVLPCGYQSVLFVSSFIHSLSPDTCWDSERHWAPTQISTNLLFRCSFPSTVSL